MLCINVFFFTTNVNSILKNIVFNFSRIVSLKVFYTQEITLNKTLTIFLYIYMVVYDWMIV